MKTISTAVTRPTHVIGRRQRHDVGAHVDADHVGGAENAERDQRQVVVARQAEDDGADAEDGDGDEQRAADTAAQRESA